MRELEQSKEHRIHLEEVQLAALGNLLARYRDPYPRILVVEPASQPTSLFTDGACELMNGKLVATVGAVIFHLQRAFGCMVGHDVVSRWQDADKQHPVSSA